MERVDLASSDDGVRFARGVLVGGVLAIPIWVALIMAARWIVL